MADFWSNTNRGYRIRLWLDQTSQSIEDNSSQVRVRLALLNTFTTFAEYNCTASVTIDGQTINWSGRPSMLSQNQVIMLIDRTVTVGHNADGTKTFNLSASFSGSGGWSPGDLNIDGNSFTLTTIPRSSSVSVSTGVIGSAVTININRQSYSFKHTVRYAWAGKSGTIATNVDTSTTWMIPLDFSNDIPNSSSGTGIIYVDTYSGSTKTGTQSATFTASVPANLKPTFSGITLSDLNSAAQNLIPSGNTFIQVISNIKVAFNGAAGSYGSSITGYYAEIVGKNQSTSSNGGSLGIMNYHGAIKIRARVSDSRGRWSDTSLVSVTVLEYFAPALSFSIVRTGSTSSTLTVTRNAKIAPLTVSGSQKNSMSLTFKVARLGTTNFQADTGQATGAWTSISSLVNSQANLAGNYLANQSWVVIGTLEDKFTRSDFMVNVATESVVLSYDRSGVGVNKIREQGALDVKGDIYADNKPIQQYQLTQNNGKSLNAERDWNDYINAGVYMGYNLLNSPQSGNGWKHVQVFKHNDNWVVQVAYDFDGQIAAVRAKTNGTWRPWKYLATKDDVQKYTQGTPWQNLPLQNGWQHHQQYNNVQYSKSFDGVVYLRGVGAKGKTAYGTVIAQLPVGFRPLHSTYVFAINDDFTVAVLCILTSGEIVVRKNVDATWLNFDNVSFKI
nr:MAG TPA: protein of unknown function DUF859 [Caudoviricetes sp.]